VKKQPVAVTIDGIKAAHSKRKKEIRDRLREFQDIWEKGSDARLWEEMVFCFFTGGCSARMGLNAVEAVRPLLLDGSQEELAKYPPRSSSLPEREGALHCGISEFFAGAL
jgi:Thermostable 8-oxoguanine DNA glycosylase